MPKLDYIEGYKGVAGETVVVPKELDIVDDSESEDDDEDEVKIHGKPVVREMKKTVVDSESEEDEEEEVKKKKGKRRKKGKGISVPSMVVLAGIVAGAFYLMKG